MAIEVLLKNGFVITIRTLQNRIRLLLIVLQPEMALQLGRSLTAEVRTLVAGKLLDAVVNS
jgi:hypothetical protein